MNRWRILNEESWVTLQVSRFPSLILAVAGLCVSSLHAQVSATISGRVLDATGAGVEGASVTVTSLETGATRTAATSDAGAFTVPMLPLGLQTVKAEKQGFRPAVRSGIQLAVGQEAEIELTLEIGALPQALEVVSDAPVVNATTSSLSGLVAEREVLDLPLNGRSFDNLLTLNPGTIDFGLKSQQTSTSNGNTFSVAGRRPYENVMLLNGVEYAGSSQLAVTPGGVSGFLLGVDAVREFNVLSGAYPAEYGKRPGAQVTVATRSGSNALHGSLFEFLRNGALDSPGYFDSGAVAPFKRNQFGASLSGPVRRNRLFLFGNYEGFRQRLAAANVAVVPDLEARQGLMPNAAGQYAPVANLNTKMLPFMATWPQPNGAELLVNGLPTGIARSYGNPAQAIREDFGILRADYAIRAADSLSATYTTTDGDNFLPLSDPLFGSLTHLQSHHATAQETHILSPRTLNTFIAGFSRSAYNYASYPTVGLPPSLSFVAGAPPGGIVIGGGTTTTGAAAITTAGPGNAAGVWNRRNLYTYADNVELDRGNHRVRFGLWFQRVQDNDDSNSRRYGVATFSTLTTFLQGTASAFQTAVLPTAELGWRSLLGAWYIDDDVRLRPNLELRAGLRDEFTTGWNEADGRAGNWLPGPGGVLMTSPRVANSAFTANRAKRLLGPRIGLAWAPGSKGNTSIRAGYGIYYSLLDALAYQLNSQPPSNGSAAAPSGGVSLLSIIPLTPGAPVPASWSYAPQGVESDARTPAVSEWNLSVERGLTANTVLRVSYAGAFGYHGLLSVDPNTIAPQTCASPAGCVSGGVSTSRGLVAPGDRYVPVGSRPNPNLSSGFFWLTEGNSSYNALMLDLSRRLSRGLQFRANYTWSKNLDMNSALTGAQASNQAQMILDRADLRRDWGPSAFNVKQQAEFSEQYDLPFGPGRRWLGAQSGAVGKLAGHWQVNAITTLLSGFPFTPQIGSNRSGDGDTRNPDRPSLDPTFRGPIILGQPNQWFNPNAFLLPAVGTYGDLGRGVFEGPGLAQVDLSLVKTTALAEGKNLQFRAEVFNLLNRANFGTPNPIVFSGSSVNPSAGLITTTVTPPRQIQLALRLSF